MTTSKIEEVKNPSRKCVRCGYEGSVNNFSRKKHHKLDPKDWCGNVCLSCVAEEDRIALEAKMQSSRAAKKVKREVIAKIKANATSKYRDRAMARLIRMDKGIVTRAELKKMQQEAKTEAEKALADQAWAAVKRVNRELRDKGEVIPPKVALTDAEMDQDSLAPDAPEEVQVEQPKISAEELQKIAESETFPNRSSDKEATTLPSGWDGEAPDENIAKHRTKADMARAELASRELSRRRLLHFVKRFKPDYDAGWVHHDICRRLEKFVRDVEAGKSPRLMLFMPPRHGKSLLASDFFPSWALGGHPHFEIIASSYAVSLPIEFSRNIRSRLEDKSYHAVFPQGARLRADSKSAEAWRTRQGGGYVAAGVGGGITGKGAHILIVDDPIKDAQEADSETVRSGVWNWWGSTAYTRLAPGGGVLVIQTRWHDDDLSGRLVQQMQDAIKEGAPADEIDDWEIVQYPAIAEDDEWLLPDGSIYRGHLVSTEIAHRLRRKGAALHPARFDKKRLMRIKRGLQPRHWSALYQQNPMPDEGEHFTKDMLRYTASVPPLKYMKLFAAADLAIGLKQQNDYSVIAIGGLDWQDQIYVVDIIRFKGDTFKIVEALIAAQKKYDLEMVGIEKGQLELAIKPVLEKRMRETRTYLNLAEGDMALVPITDKLTRARPLQGRMQQGMVYLLNTQPWLEATVHELLRFPGGVNDDIVDALAWLVRLIMKQTPPAPPGADRKRKSWRDNLNSLMGQNVKHPMLS